MTSEECTLLLKDFDFVHFWTYNDFSHQGHRMNIEQIRRTHELCRGSKKVMIGLNFYGTQYSLNEHRAGKTGVGNGNTLMGKEYLKLLSDPSAKLEFNYENMEHAMVLERDNTIVFFPSMTSLEYRIELARELGVGVGIWDYGQGLDYFANLL
uniref:GH18 domain-containing protein n=1 Tax=Caenorhabditis japonica TaxID=281687 RepID=A0A8R1ER17_CAEJA